MVAYAQTWKVDKAKILSQREADAVLADLDRRAKRSKTAVLNKVIFRLSSYAGLRASEIAGITLQDLILDVEQPYISVPAAISKGHKARIVPIWSNATVEELKSWKARRLAMGAQASDVLVCSLHETSLGNSLNRHQISRHFQSACKGLGKERVKTQSAHSGRHFFCSSLLGHGIPIQEAKLAMGHGSLSVTSLYSHTYKSREMVHYSID